MWNSVQAFDAVIGFANGDVSKGVGPAVLAVATGVATVWYTRRSAVITD